MQCVHDCAYTSASHVVEHCFPEPSCSGFIEAGRWRANMEGVSDPYKGYTPLVRKARITHLILMPIYCRFTACTSRVYLWPASWSRRCGQPASCFKSLPYNRNRAGYLVRPTLEAQVVHARHEVGRFKANRMSPRCLRTVYQRGQPPPKHIVHRELYIDWRAQRVLNSRSQVCGMG